MPGPKLHHYIPQFYPRRFADADGRITLRRRGGQVVTTSVRNVGAETGLYATLLDDGTKSVSAEFTLSSLDAVAARAIADLVDAGGAPDRGSRERQALALFMALQAVRTPEEADRVMFARNVVAFVGAPEVSAEDVARYLHEVHLGFEPAGPEVEAATDLVRFQVEQGLPDAQMRLELMFTTATKELAPLLEGMAWSLEVCRKPRFATADRIPAIWHRPRREDRTEGTGIANAEEAWLPLDPSHMLVLRSSGDEHTRRVDPKRARFVNPYHPSSPICRAAAPGT